MRKHSSITISNFRVITKEQIQDDSALHFSQVKWLHLRLIADGRYHNEKDIPLIVTLSS